jgi:hypothetical protein
VVELAYELRIYHYMLRNVLHCIYSYILFSLYHVTLVIVSERFLPELDGSWYLHVIIVFSGI